MQRVGVRFGLKLAGLSGRLADVGFDLAVFESRGEILRIHGIYRGAQNVPVFIHGDGVASRQCGGGVQGAEDGGISGEG